MKAGKSRLLSLVATVVVIAVVLAVRWYLGFLKRPGGSQEDFIRAQTFDSINELQESPSQETIQTLKTLIESPLLDPYLRERGVLVLTDLSIRLEEDAQTRDYLKGIASNQQFPSNLQSAALASIYLIDELFPRQKHGLMQVDVVGEVRPGSRISLVIRLLSDIHVEDARVDAGVPKQYSPMEVPEAVESPIITAISRPPFWRGSFKANTLLELTFDFQIERQGDVELPVVYKFDFDSIDYEIEKQSLYFRITKTGGEFSALRSSSRGSRLTA
ncbi:MAG: hypothetical protein ACUVTR_06625 [Dehalococcoidia bacterium]